uniref:Transmembrane protein 182 n=1 Tax=Hippocampus comes TaxID=109280 RepID=A0A3Q2Z5D8_HIPCM
MSKRFHLAPDERLSVLLFFALFSVALGLLSTLFSCTTDYWLLGSAELCHPGSGSRETEVAYGTLFGADSMLFHEGLFWRCSFPARSQKYSLWDLWISPLVGHVILHMCTHTMSSAYLIATFSVFRTFWSIFLITGVATVTTGGLSVICTAALSKHKFYKVGGALLICGGVCLLAVVLMYVMWVHVLDTLEEFARGQQVSGCKSFHLSIQHGPSFQLAPVASFFSLLSGLLFLVIAHGVRSLEPHRTHTTPHPPELQTDL